MLTIHSKFRNASNTIIKKENPAAVASSLTTDFTVNLNEPYNNVVGIKLAGAELMNGYYTFSEYLKTNQFSITIFLIDATTPNGRSDERTFPFSFVEGTYTASQISQLVSSTINSAIGDMQNGWLPLLPAPPTGPVGGTGGYGMGIPGLIWLQYSSNKGKFYFKKNPITGGTTFNGVAGNTAYPNIADINGVNRPWGFDLDFRVPSEPNRDIEMNFGWLCGYQKPIYYYEKDYTTNVNMVLLEGFNPEAILDFTGTKFFLLEITDYNKNYSEVFKYNTYKRNINYKDILAKIPNTASTTNIIFEDSSDRIFKTRKYFGPVRISKLRIRLLDDFGRVVDLNGGDLIITLEIETLDMPYKNFRQ